jgi:phosphatidylserine/phosphatidylglycerophosphate/cardiolipin synthase-like enzyme
MDQSKPIAASGTLGDGTKVLVQPDDGVLPLLQLINDAAQSIYIKQFTFTHSALIEAVIAAHKAGRDVRVMLNPHRSSGDRANDDAYAQFQAAKVNVAWANPTFAVTHEKSMLIDNRLALVATFNLTEKYLTLTRDYGVLTNQPTEVAQIHDCFMADWNRQPFHPRPDTALLWSNQNSRSVMSAFIDGARHTLDIQHPKFVDATILDRIVQARARGVHVRLLCGGRHGISSWDVLDTFASLRVLSHVDVKVRKQKNLRLHAKLLLADGKRAQIGSMNIDRSAFDLRRELGAVITGKSAVALLSHVFEADWEGSHHYDPPDPLLSHEHVEDDFPHDPALEHE